MKTTHALTLAALTLALTSCETTGDPNQGGLFGWSQGKANQRIAARQEYLSELERDNAYQRGRTNALEEQAYRKQKQVNQW